MDSLNVLICGTDKPAMQRMAQELPDVGVTVGTHHPIDILLAKIQEADFFLIDLDRLNGVVLCSLLSIIRINFPMVPVTGFSTKCSDTLVGNGFKLDACYNKVPHLEDIMVLATHVATKHIHDAGLLRAVSTSLPSIKKPVTN